MRIRSAHIYVFLATCALTICVEANAATRLAPSEPCKGARPVSPKVDYTINYSNGKNPTHMVITPEQLAFDLCRAAAQINGFDANQPTASPRQDQLVDIDNRMRTIALEAHLLLVCPHQKYDADATSPTDGSYALEHEWGCGPYGVSPSSASTVAADFTCPTARPPFPLPSGEQHALFSGHPPATPGQAAFDLCSLAHVVSDLTLSPGGSKVPQNLEGLLVRLETEVHLAAMCWNGRTGYPPDETEIDFARDREYGCGPYIK
jgi:hypothetical protein